MSVNIQKERKNPTLDQIRLAFTQISWRETLLAALVMAILWCGFFLANNVWQVLAGIVPVSAGLLLGRRVKKQILLHGLLLGLIGFTIGLVIIAIYGLLIKAGLFPPYHAAPQKDLPSMALSFSQLILFYVSFSLFALLPFPAFGTVMASRSKQREDERRAWIAERGGTLEDAGTIRTLEDLRGLALPQFGTYVSNVFKKKGFTFKDYRFIDKDKHLDLEFVYQEKPYLLRLSVADKVRPGTLESLLQDMRHRNITHGLVITSTEFAPETLKNSKHRRNVVLIDGQTLFAAVEK